jgi:hypothetical protein
MAPGEIALILIFCGAVKGALQNCSNSGIIDQNLQGSIFLKARRITNGNTDVNNKEYRPGKESTNRLKSKTPELKSFGCLTTSANQESVK